jgi:hypothetical protein
MAIKLLTRQTYTLAEMNREQHLGPDSQSTLSSYGFVTFQKLLSVNH